jgi:hypothetical protein
VRLLCSGGKRRAKRVEAEEAEEEAYERAPRVAAEWEVRRPAGCQPRRSVSCAAAADAGTRMYVCVTAARRLCASLGGRRDESRHRRAAVKDG